MSFETASSGSASGSWQPVPAQPDTADEVLARVIHVGYWGPSAEGDVTPSRGSFAAAVAVLAAGYVPPADMAHWEAVWRAEGARDALLAAADDLHGIESALDAMEDIILDAEDKPFRFTPTERRRIAIEDWLRDRAASLARQEPTSAEGAGS